MHATLCRCAQKTQRVAGADRGGAPGVAMRSRGRLWPDLPEALAGRGWMPEGDGPQLAAHERRQGEAHDLIVDGVERRRQRPKNPQIQAIHYSGKKKAHTDKNVVVVNTQTKRVSFLSNTPPC